MSNNVRLYESVFSKSSDGLFPSHFSMREVGTVWELLVIFGFVQALQTMGWSNEVINDDDAFEERLEIDDEVFESS